MKTFICDPTFLARCCNVAELEAEALPRDRMLQPDFVHQVQGLIHHQMRIIALYEVPTAQSLEWALAELVIGQFGQAAIVCPPYGVRIHHRQRDGRSHTLLTQVNYPMQREERGLSLTISLSSANFWKSCPTTVTHGLFPSFPSIG